MIQVIWDTRGYLFWLIAVSLFCLVMERLRPWRREQKLWRKQFGQDLFWLFFNGHYFAIVLAYLTAFLFAWAMPGIAQAKNWNLLSGQALWVQFFCFFLVKDFLEWCIHNALHRIPWLWEFHKLHHSIEELDWIGDFRFHWMEIIVYQGLTYLPLIVLGVDGSVILCIAVVGTLIGHLNHSNLDLTWGPLRYVMNSPRMHVWHHAMELPKDRCFGVNFGISLSIWDWLFGTVWWPSRRESPTQQPQRLGFEGMAGYPRSLPARFLYPVSRLWLHQSSGTSQNRAD